MHVRALDKNRRYSYYAELSFKLRSLKSVLFRSQNYFTKGHEHLGEARNVLEEQSPFVYPPCSLMFSYFQYWKAKKRTTDKERRMDVFKAKDSHDLLRRLRVRNYNFDV